MGVGPRIAVDPLGHVLSHPDEDQPRINFAKKLPLTDPHRDFILHQLTMARLEKDRHNPERLDAVLASSQLLQSHYRDWRPKWDDDAAARVQEYCFHRGFVELIRISGSDFQKAASKLFTKAPIRHLDFVSTAGRWRHLSNDENLSTIRSISISNNNLTDEDVGWFVRSRYLTNLRWLSLSNNDIKEDGVRSIIAARKNLPALHYISFAGNYCDPVERFASDGDLITDIWLPEVGEKLEKEFGRINWLHIRTRSLRDLPPNRFVIPDRESRNEVQASPTGDLAKAV